MPAEEKELRVRFVDGVDFKKLGKIVLNDFTAYGNSLYYATPAEDNFEGFRLCYDKRHGDGWTLMRMSLHDPVLPINVESNVKGGTIQLAKDLYYFLRRYSFLDITPITDYINTWRAQTKDNLKEQLLCRGMLTNQHE